MIGAFLFFRKRTEISGGPPPPSIFVLLRPEKRWPLLKSPKSQIPVDFQVTRRERARAGEREAGISRLRRLPADPDQRSRVSTFHLSQLRQEKENTNPATPRSTPRGRSLLRISQFASSRPSTKSHGRRCWRRPCEILRIVFKRHHPDRYGLRIGRKPHARLLGFKQLSRPRQRRRRRQSTRLKKSPRC